MSARLRGLAIALASLPLAGCFTLHRAPPPPGSTKFGSDTVVLPTQLLDNYLIVEAKWDRYGPYHFLVDTGSSATLVTPELAKRYEAKNAESEGELPVQVRSSQGRTTVLAATTLTEIELGKARFASVPALIAGDTCSAISAHLGLKIDGVLGFPLFHAATLTLDYPRARVVLRPSGAPVGQAGTTVPFDDSTKTPFVSVRLGDKPFSVLLDSGSDEALTLNPDGLAPRFAFGPIAGPLAGTLTGDRTEQVGRLADTVFVAGYAVPRPIAELSSGISAIDGGILKNFMVTFDPGSRQVTFLRDATDPIAVPSLRSTGLSFDKTPAYWRVASVVPDSPAAAAGVETGDLVTHIDGEPMDRWDIRRYDQLLANAENVVYTFLNGTRETDKRMKVLELVP